MRLRVFVVMAILVLSVSPSFAESSTADYELSTGSSGSSFDWSSASGFLEAGGATALIAGLVDLFKDHSSGVHVSGVSTTASEAPEISTSGFAAGLALLAGALFISREKQRKQKQ